MRVPYLIGHVGDLNRDPILENYPLVALMAVVRRCRKVWGFRAPGGAFYMLVSGGLGFRV